MESPYGEQLNSHELDSEPGERTLSEILFVTTINILPPKSAPFPSSDLGTNSIADFAFSCSPTVGQDKRVECSA